MEVVEKMQGDTFRLVYSTHVPEFSYAQTLISSAYPFSENENNGRMSGSM